MKYNKPRARSINSEKPNLYKEFIGMKCANPDCMSGFEAETHHIFPIKIGGKNDYWNFICLCSKCHRSFKLHSQWEENCTKLFFWKSYQELNLWGFYLDEQDEKYYEKLALLLRVNLLKNKNIL